MKKSFILLVTLLLSGVIHSPLLAKGKHAAAPTEAQITTQTLVTIKTVDRQKLSELGGELLKLDLAARDAFNRAHPGVLPEL